MQLKKGGAIQEEGGHVEFASSDYQASDATEDDPWPWWINGLSRISEEYDDEEDDEDDDAKPDVASLVSIAIAMGFAARLIRIYK